MIKHEPHSKAGQKTKAKDTTLELTDREVEWLLRLIKTSSFEGKDVQTVYETAVKLQNMLQRG